MQFFCSVLAWGMLSLVVFLSVHTLISFFSDETNTWYVESILEMVR